MAAIYQADIYCDDCAEQIKRDICVALWRHKENSDCPDGVFCGEFDTLGELDDYLRHMDERHYDSNEYPKWSDDDAESDGPEHCASRDDCLNAEELPSGAKIGYCFCNSLTSEGEDYLKEMVREGGEVAEFWKGQFTWIDFEEDSDDED